MSELSSSESSGVTPLTDLEGTASSSSDARVLACISVPTPIEEGHRDSSVVTATMAIGITDASHAIFSIIAGGITPESTPVEIASAGSVHDVTCGFSTDSGEMPPAMCDGRRVTLDPSIAASPGPSSGSSTCGSIALVSRDAGSARTARWSAEFASAARSIAGSAGAARLSSGSTGVACGDRSTTAARSSSISAGVACVDGSKNAAQSSSGSECVACDDGSTTAALPVVDLETLAADGIPLDCFEDGRLVLGLSAAGSGVLLLGTLSSRIVSLV